jgi:F420-dependent oxidoreductase-like protein
MRVGLYVTRSGTLDAIIEEVRIAEAAGLDSAFFPQVTSWDALTVAALAGRQVPRISLGPAVVRTYATHPLALAGQALSVQAAIGNRLTLGIGPGHRETIERQYGMRFEEPARYVREYLAALQPLLRGEQTAHHGRFLTAAGVVDVPGSTPPSVLISALGPAMLRTAGELADGTVTMWTGAEMIGDHIAPALTSAAAQAGRPEPRIVATVAVSVTADPDGARQDVADRLGAAGDLAAYRRILQQQGKSSPQETVVAGDDAVVAEGIRRFAQAGVTELVASAVGSEQDRARTIDTLGHLRTTLLSLAADPLREWRMLATAIL